MNLIKEVKKKREFFGLPDSVVKRALVESKDDIKEARSLLRKYFGVFLTNRVLKGKGDLLGIHMSSKKRDYGEFYSKILKGVDDVGSVVDLGCGVNGFSYEYLPKGIEYVGIEAAGQLVELMNVYFKEKDFDARAVCLDLFDVEGVVKILRKAKKSRVVLMFQVIDALENMKRDFSKEFISVVMENVEVLVISLPLVSLGGRKKFAVRRKWLVDFLIKNFDVKKDFEMFGERIICVRK
ncbi:hypothetical protein K8R30_03150 [archaeon]|nr:hypothetical protein [archaeon]